MCNNCKCMYTKVYKYDLASDTAHHHFFSCHGMNRTQNAQTTKDFTVAYFSTLVWKIPWMEEPARLQSMGSRRATSRLSDFTFTFMHWRRKWQPTPVFLPGESQGQGSLVVCRLWGRTESDTTEVT